MNHTLTIHSICICSASASAAAAASSSSSFVYNQQTRTHTYIETNCKKPFHFVWLLIIVFDYFFQQIDCALILRTTLANYITIRHCWTIGDLVLCVCLTRAHVSMCGIWIPLLLIYSHIVCKLAQNWIKIKFNFKLRLKILTNNIT